MHSIRFPQAMAPTLLMTLAMTLVFASPAQAQERQPQIPELNVETYRLPNGLEVILHEDHTIPVVAVNLWYKVGSKNEARGRTGFAHLFEHLMFQGSQHLEGEYFEPLEQIGAEINGSTTTDRTNYFETVPSNALELALWQEADRMGFLLPSLTQEKLDNQRDVVKNERRQRYDNQPYGQVIERLLAALYPVGHPYHHTVIGSMEDLSAANLSDVKSFFRRFYNPNNASLCLAGDFDPAEAKRLIEKYFGPIPAGPEIEPMEPRPTDLEAKVEIAINDRVSLPRTYLVWPTIPRGHEDEAALDVLSAILGGLDKENRLERALIYDNALASEVSVGHDPQAIAGDFSVVVTARPEGPTLDELVERVTGEIARLKLDGPTETEVLKAQNTVESGLIFGLQSMTDRADFLNAYNVEMGDPMAYKDELRRLFEVTPEDVRRVARAYLTEQYVRIDVNPGPPTPRPPEVAVDPDAQLEIVTEEPPIEDTFDRSVMPELGPTPEFAPPPVDRRRLSNGLEVLVVRRPELPILTLDLVVKAGADRSPEGKDGIAYLTAELLTEGTTSLDALELAGALSLLGASIDASAGFDAMSLSLSTLTKHTDAALGLFTDVLLNPAFAEDDLIRQRDLLLSSLMQQRDSAFGLAMFVYPELLYGKNHPYGRQLRGTLKTVPTISRLDVEAFHKMLFHPNHAALIVVGDTTADAIVEKLELALKDWEAGEIPALNLPEPKTAPSDTLYLIDRPESAQSALMVSQVGVPRDTPDYFPLTVMNSVLGGQFSSRLNLNLREDKGYTYGARSVFAMRRGPGPFAAYAPVQTAVTAPSLFEIHKELTGITGDQPVTEDELSFAKSNLVMSFPSGWATTGGVASALEEIALYGLPDDYYTTYQDKLQSVTLEQVRQVAREHLHPKSMVMLVVGDRSTIADSLRELPFVPSITVLDEEGNPVEPAAEAEAETEAKADDR